MNQNHLAILLIDDEAAQLQSLSSFLRRRDHEVFTASNGPDGFTIARENTIDFVLTDFRMPQWDGLTVLQKIKSLNPEIEVAIMTAFGNIDGAVEIMKAGAYDYLTKPIDLDMLENLVQRVREKRLLVKENRRLREQLQEQTRLENIISRNDVMEKALNTAVRVAESKATVLLRGESGTGKELFAQAIHFASPRKNRPFVVVNIAALPENLLESELFGHEKGAYTGASQQRIGRFEMANGGTLFLDELGDIPLTVQSKLLRAIQFGEIERLGSNKTIAVDVRIVAATHRNLEEMIRNGEFREDLYYRMNVITINIPPLSTRKNDIPLLVNHFIRKIAKQYDKAVKGITREALDQLMKYHFPGNVRELQNMIEHAVVLTREEHITAQDLPAPLQNDDSDPVFNPKHLDNGYLPKLQAFETAMLQEALQRSSGNQSAAARLLGITERHLRSRMAKLGLKK